MVNNRFGRENRARRGQPLHAGGDVDSLAEVVEPVVERHRQAGPGVQGLADSRAIFVTQAVVQHEPARRLLEERGKPWQERRAQLKGVSEAVTVYEVS